MTRNQLQRLWEALVGRFNPDIRSDAEAGGGKEASAPLASLIAAAGALWGVVNTAATTTDSINRRRDAVIAGRLDGAPISIDHRLLIIDHDWWGMVVATIAGCLLFAMLMTIIAAGQRKWYFGLFFVACAGLSIVNAVSWSVSLRYEQPAMTGAICRDFRAGGETGDRPALERLCPSPAR